MAAKPKEADTEADEAGEAAAATPKKKLPLKMIIIAVAALAVVGGGGTFGYTFGALFVALGLGRLYLLRRR